MQSKATTVDAYLASLPADRREALQAVRKLFQSNLDRKYAEGMSYGMIGWSVPHSVFPAGYHCNPAQPLPFAGLASQKGHMSLYLFGLYCDQVDGKPGPLLRWFEDAWRKSGKKLDMGKSCIRFRSLDDLALDVLAQALRRMPCDEFIALYERSLDAARTAKKPSASKPAARKVSTHKAGAKTVAAKSARPTVRRKPTS